MSQYLPTATFHAIDFTKRNERNLMKTSSRTPNNEEREYFLESDLEYLSNVHEKTKRLP